MYDRALEERFNKLDLETVERWIEEKVTEDLYIEFKREPRDDNDLKKILSKLISAFGNAAGGICVWGIDAGQDGDGIDRIRDAAPISEPARFMSRLVDLSMGATAPGHAGVQHRTILCEDGRGFVISLVPAFDGQPLMALVDHVYRVRTSKGVAPMEHFQVADLFGKRACPDLRLEASAPDICAWITGGQRQVRVRLRVVNHGRVTADEVGVALRITGDMHLQSFDSITGLSYAASDGSEYPHFWKPAAAISLHVGESARCVSVHTHPLHPEQGWVNPVVVEYVAVCRDSQPRVGRIEISHEAILQVLTRKSC